MLVARIEIAGMAVTTVAMRLANTHFILHPRAGKEKANHNPYRHS